MSRPRIKLSLVLDDGAARHVGEVLIELEGRQGVRDMFAGALVMAEPVEATFELLAPVCTTNAARLWEVEVLEPEDEPELVRFRGRYFLDTLNRAQETRIAELCLASTGEPIGVLRK